MKEKILIANRGEIAVRIIRTAKKMGLHTITIHSERDRFAFHTICSDASYYLDGKSPEETYLDMDKIISIAKKTGAKYIHPGYGFLAENAEFSEKVQKQGLFFVGPPPLPMERMGNKVLARKIAEEVGVPVILGSSAFEDLKEGVKYALEIGFPVMIKSALGGGGKGMRIVYSKEEFEKEFPIAQQEAINAFGNPKMYLEKYIASPKHIEIQILSDRYGNTVHLFERECSIQRRHQKLIEESPCVILTDKKRKELGECACEIARKAEYENAGTVEFLYDLNNDKFYFLEVNARLQVEHPVTEMRLGLDLVEEQIKITKGEKLSIRQKDLKPEGSSIEVRIYAEDPLNSFFPSPGKIQFLKEPSGPFVRVDSGVYEGYEVPIEYDPLLMKVITWGRNRRECIERMKQALKELWILGCTTTKYFSLQVIQEKEFFKGNYDVHYLSKYKPKYDEDNIHALGIASLFSYEETRKETPVKKIPSQRKGSLWKYLYHREKGGFYDV